MCKGETHALPPGAVPCCRLDRGSSCSTMHTRARLGFHCTPPQIRIAATLPLIETAPDCCMVLVPDVFEKACQDPTSRALADRIRADVAETRAIREALRQALLQQIREGEGSQQRHTQGKQVRRPGP
jgi:hypothetical protein